MDIGKAGKWILSKLTILQWLPNYGSATFRSDLTAGVTVGVLLIPQSMAYAVIAGVPPVYGLYASVVPLLIYPLLGTSKQLSVGIVAIDMLIVAAGVGLIADPASERYIYLVLLLGLMAGLFQIFMSVVRLGFIVNLLSKPVILGFTAAAPIIISFSQFGNLLGLEISQSQHLYVILPELYEKFAYVDIVTACIGVGCIILLVVFRKYYPVAPEALIVVIFSSILIWALDLDEGYVEVVGLITGGLPNPKIPSFSMEEMRRLLPTAITLALVQFMNVVTLGRTFASKHKYTIRPNRELLALGTANFFGSIFRSVPVSGSFSRSAINDQAGAKTPLSNVFAAVLIIAALLVLTPLLYYIPMPALAAIIIVASMGLIDIKEVRFLFRTKEVDGYLALFTFLTTLIIGIQEGILLGIGASLIVVLLRTSRPNVAVLGHIEGSRFFRDTKRFPDARQIEGILILRVDASFSFNNAEYFKDFILQKSEEQDRKIKAVVIDGISINDLDTTAIEALQLVADNLESLGIELHFAGLKGPIRDVMLRSGLARKLGGTHFHMTSHSAVKYILDKWGRDSDQTSLYKDYMDTID